MNKRIPILELQIGPNESINDKEQLYKKYGEFCSSPCSMEELDNEEEKVKT